jgi:DNA-binding MarR family transcriptional regulator
LVNGDNRKNEQRKEEESHLQSNRDRIYQYIANNPGCHLRKISKDLDLAMGDTQYHLKTLEKTHLIKSRRIGVFRRYYPVSIYGERLESLLATLRQEVPRDIIVFLIENPGATQAELAKHQGFSPPTINWHMSRLIEIGLVSSHKEGKFLKYRIEGDIKDVTSILRRYYPSIWTKLSNRLADLFLDISAASRMESNHRRKMMTEKNDNQKNASDKKEDEDK